MLMKYSFSVTRVSLQSLLMKWKQVFLKDISLAFTVVETLACNSNYITAAHTTCRFGRGNLTFLRFLKLFDSMNGLTFC
jgi:hypothetical protein